MLKFLGRSIPSVEISSVGWLLMAPRFFSAGVKCSEILLATCVETHLSAWLLSENGETSQGLMAHPSRSETCHSLAVNSPFFGHTKDVLFDEFQIP